ncbi:hypothetical protein HZS_6289, partial [Henneguya salminicola]
MKNPRINSKKTNNKIQKTESKNLIESIDRLIILKIARKLNVRSVVNLFSCCKMLHETLDNNNLWFDLYNKYFAMCKECSSIRSNDNKNFKLHWDTEIINSKVLLSLNSDIFISVNEHLSGFGLYSLITYNKVIYLQHPLYDSISHIFMTMCGLVCITQCGSVLLWSIDTKTFNTRPIYEIIFEHNQAVSSFVHEKSILVTASNDFTVCILDLENFKLKQKIAFTSKVTGVAISSKWIAISHQNISILLIDEFYNTFATILNHSLNVHFVKLFSTLLISVSNEKSLQIYSITDLEVKYEVKLTNTIPITSQDIKFLDESLVLINEYSVGIHLLCLKKYHILRTYSKTNEIIQFETIGMLLCCLECNYYLSVYDLKLGVMYRMKKLHSVKCFTFHISNNMCYAI